MIATRRRRKQRNWKPVLLPAGAVAVAVAALAWPPSHRAIADGPLKPAWSLAAAGGSVVARPLTFAAQQQHIADQQREMNRLSESLENDRREREQKNSRIAELQGTVAHLQSEPRPTPLPPLPKPRASTAPAAAAAVSESAVRTGAYWASMDAEKAAAVVQRLPDDYVTRVFRHMPPDAVADIMNALPPKIAARLSAEAPAR